jgi:hypothetical protein
VGAGLVKSPAALLGYFDRIQRMRNIFSTQVVQLDMWALTNFYEFS